MPGPTTAARGETARKRSAWIVAGIYEREGTAMATIDLAKRAYDTWLGELRGRLFKELRLDLRAEPAGALR